MVPNLSIDSRGMTPGTWSSFGGVAENAMSFPVDTYTPTFSGPLQPVKASPANDMRSDNAKQETKKLLGKIKKITFKKVVPNGIG